MSDLSILSEKDRSTVEEFAAALRAMLGDRLIKLILYGSKARGEGREEADIDILVVVEGLKHKEEQQMSDIAGEILVNSGVLISIIVFDSNDLEWSMGEKSPFIKSVSREGIEIG